MRLLLVSKHHVSKLIQQNLYTFFSLELKWKYPSSLNTLNCIQGLQCWEIKTNFFASFKKYFSIDIDRKKHLPVSILSFIAMFILFLTTRYLQRGPENLRSQLKLTFPHTNNICNIGIMPDPYFDPIYSAYSVLIYFFERLSKVARKVARMIMKKYINKNMQK